MMEITFFQNSEELAAGGTNAIPNWYQRYDMARAQRTVLYLLKAALDFNTQDVDTASKILSEGGIKIHLRRTKIVLRLMFNDLEMRGDNPRIPASPTTSEASNMEREE